MKLGDICYVAIDPSGELTPGKRRVKVWTTAREAELKAPRWWNKKEERYAGSRVVAVRLIEVQDPSEPQAASPDTAPGQPSDPSETRG